MNAAGSLETQAFRNQILERRARLEAAAGAIPADYVNGLLEEIDSALARIGDGTFGLCETCHDPIEVDRLQVNPLVRFCLDHLSKQEARAHEQDLELATQIQSKLLPPQSVVLEEWETHYLYESAGPVGGDYCEVLPQDDGLFFAVGDVAGKGVAASLLMTHLNAIFRSLLSLRLPVSEVMSRANRLFCENTLTSHYATLVCGRTAGAVVEFCNAGHCPPLLLSRRGIERIDCPGLPLGLFCSGEYPLSRVELGEGESLVLYSDGITETQDQEGNEFGEEGLSRSLERHSGSAAGSLAGEVLRDVKRFRGANRPSDDVTLLVVRRRRLH
jgi:phosphoserine phosphatase RsbU/P